MICATSEMEKEVEGEEERTTLHMISPFNPPAISKLSLGAIVQTSGLKNPSSTFL
jgi:hypothetical protein